MNCRNKEEKEKDLSLSVCGGCVPGNRAFYLRVHRVLEEHGPVGLLPQHQVSTTSCVRGASKERELNKKTFRYEDVLLSDSKL